MPPSADQGPLRAHIPRTPSGVGDRNRAARRGGGGQSESEGLVRLGQVHLSRGRTREEREREREREREID